MSSADYQPPEPVTRAEHFMAAAIEYIRTHSGTVTHTVSYYNYDGTELLYSETVNDGDDAAGYDGETPTKAETAQYTYSFVGWSETAESSTADSGVLENITADKSVYAAFEPVEKTFTVTFYSGESVMYTAHNVAYNGTAVYGGTTPTKEDTEQYTYSFAGWNADSSASAADADALKNVTANRSVYAIFSQTAREYTVSFYNGENLIGTDTVSYGGTASYTGATPTKESTQQYSYNFIGWNTDSSASAADGNALVNVTANRTVYAIFEQVARGYTVYFYNGETLLETVTGVPSGGTATYAGETPAKQGYIFTGWSPSNTNITVDTSCYAQFEEDEMYESITDTWPQIIANIGNGTYSTKYQVGDTKKIDLGTEGEIIMRVVGIDADDLADNSGKAPMTWISKQLLKTSHRMNPSYSSGTEGTGSLGGWEKTEMRSYLKETVKPLIPETVRNAIKPVKKYTRIYNVSGSYVSNVLTTEDVWIPSYQEVFGNYSAESSGVYYSTAFPDSASRIKSKVGSSAAWWWLRSASNGSSFDGVYTDGSYNYGSAYNTGGVALGFCLGAPVPTYTVRFYDGDTLLQTVENVPEGGTATFTGTEPTKENYKFTGWLPLPTNITADTACYAQFEPLIDGLITDDWATISSRSAAGTAANYYSVGDCKAVDVKGTMGTLALDTTLYVYILGFDHNVSNGESRGITFGGFKTDVKGTDVALCDSNYGSNSTDGSKWLNMSHWGNYNYGGWKGSDMRYDILGSTNVQPSGYGSAPTTSKVGYDATSTCATTPVANTLMSCLPSDLRSVMKPMTKYTDNKGNSSNVEANVTTSIDYLPLLSEYEVQGTRSYANQYEQNKQSQYTYYSDGNSKVKYNHSATSNSVEWWVRSPYYTSRYNFCFVYTDGGARTSIANYSRGVAPAFLI